MRVQGAGTDAGGVRHGEFDHVAVFHAGVDDLTAQLAGWLPSAAAPTDAVLVCLDPAGTEAVGAALATRRGPMTVLPADVRYRRPTGAMRLLHDFTRDAVDAGATRVWSIGALDLTADDDGRWARYESAVDEVLAHLPLVGVCCFDTDRQTPAALAVARRTHRHVRDASTRRPSASFRARAHDAPTTWWIPTGAPEVELDARDHVAARRAAGAVAVAAGCAATQVTDLELITSELTTNAILHGGEPATVRVWRHAERIVLQVSDHGPGPADVFPDLRPPAGGAIGGLGLWIVGQLADRFHLARTAGVTAVSVALELP